MAHSLKLQTVAAAVALGIGVAALCACGGQARDGEPSGVEEDTHGPREGPVLVTMRWDRGYCSSNCWFVVEAQSRAVLVMSDEQGNASLDIQLSELDELWGMLGSAELRDALLDPDDCHGLDGYTRTLSVTWASGMVLTDETAFSCTVNGSSHPYRAVYDELLKLMDRYSQCGPSDPPERALCGLR